MKCVPIAGCIVKKDGKYLIARRARGEHRAGLWEFPAGRIEKGEKALDAAKRELREETGLKPSKISFFGIHERFDGKNDGIYKPVFMFLVTPKNKTVKLSHEHEEYDWLTPKEMLKKNIGVDTRYFIKNYLLKKRK